MRITSGTDLLAQLDAGTHLKLEDNVVKTEGGLAHAMRKIGDFFRSLTAGGREAIRTRSENLRAAMGDLLRSGMDRELARAADLPDVQALRTREGFDGALERIRMARTLREAGMRNLPDPRNLPQAIRTLNLLKARNLPEGVAPAILDFGAAARTAEDIGRMKELLKADTLNTWLKQKAEHIDSRQDGIHASWPADMHRAREHTTINGRPPEEDFCRQIAELIPNRTMRGFVTLLTSQAGLESSFVNIPFRNEDPHFHLPEGTAPADFLLSFDSNAEEQRRQMEIRIQDNAAVVTLGQDVALRSMGDGRSLARCRYDMELRIPLDQDVPEGGTPQFEITSLRCTPSPADAARA